MLITPSPSLSISHVDLYTALLSNIIKRRKTKATAVVLIHQGFYATGAAT